MQEKVKARLRELAPAATQSTEGEIKVCTWLREISSCSCLTILPGPAWVLLSKTYKPLFPPLYVLGHLTRCRTGNGGKLSNS